MYNLSKEDFYRWKMDQVGQEVFKAIREAREQWAQYLINGGTIYSSEDTAKTVGIIAGLDNLLEFEVEDKK